MSIKKTIEEIKAVKEHREELDIVKELREAEEIKMCLTIANMGMTWVVNPDCTVDELTDKLHKTYKEFKL